MLRVVRIEIFYRSSTRGALHLHSKTGRDQSRQLPLWLVERRDRSWFWRPVLDLQRGPGQVSYRALNSYLQLLLTIGWYKTNGHMLVGLVRQQFETGQDIVRNANKQRMGCELVKLSLLENVYSTPDLSTGDLDHESRSGWTIFNVRLGFASGPACAGLEVSWCVQRLGLVPPYGCPKIRFVHFNPLWHWKVAQPPSYFASMSGAPTMQIWWPLVSRFQRYFTEVLLWSPKNRWK